METTTTNNTGTFESITNTGAALKVFYEINIKQQAEEALLNAEVGATVTFPQGGGRYELPQDISHPFLINQTPVWVKVEDSATLIVGKDDGYGGYSALFGEIVVGTNEFDDFDAFGTIGRGRVIDPGYQITIRKEQEGVCKVSAVRFECEVQDLYDFNFEDTGYTDLPQQAACLQIGYGNGSNGASRDVGKIYCHRIFIDHIYSYPFDQISDPSEID